MALISNPGNNPRSYILLREAIRIGPKPYVCREVSLEPQVFDVAVHLLTRRKACSLDTVSVMGRGGRLHRIATLLSTASKVSPAGRAGVSEATAARHYLSSTAVSSHLACQGPIAAGKPRNLAVL